MTRVMCLLLTAAMVLFMARADAQIEPEQYLLLFGSNSSSGGSVPINGLMLEAGGGSVLLFEDGVSHLCLESGC